MIELEDGNFELPSLRDLVHKGSQIAVQRHIIRDQAAQLAMRVELSH